MVTSPLPAAAEVAPEETKTEETPGIEILSAMPRMPRSPSPDDDANAVGHEEDRGVACIRRRWGRVVMEARVKEEPADDSNGSGGSDIQ